MYKQVERKTLNTGQLVLTPRDFRQIERKLGNWKRKEIEHGSFETAIKRFELSTEIEPRATLSAIGCLEGEQGYLMYRFSRNIGSDELRMYAELLATAFSERHHSRSNGLYVATIQPSIELSAVIGHAKRLAEHLESNYHLRMIKDITEVARARQGTGGSKMLEEESAKALIILIRANPIVQTLIEVIALKETQRQLDLKPIY
ncbi:MAG: hypothetical protein ABII22_04155 [Candidatus Micrarchaeota archaeon]